VTSAEADAPTHLSISTGPLVGPVLRRVVGMVAARADMPLDRLDDAVLLADMVAEHVGPHVIEGRVGVALASGHRALTLRIGPMREGGAAALIADAVVPGVGNVIERLADTVEVETADGGELLVVRLAYSDAPS
jgi:serine/threonine-protein kinase RsbW